MIWDWMVLIRVLSAVGLVTAVIVLTSRLKLGLVSEMAQAMIRALVQLTALALLLSFVFQMEDFAPLLLVLAVMLAFASLTSARRVRDLPNAFRVSLVSILASSVLTITVMVVIGTLPLRGEYLIPLGGMVIGNTMNINSLALDRLRGEVVNQTARVEAALALGARYDQAIAPMVRKGVRSSLIPTVDNMKTLGLVWIPGLMAGMVLAGADPMEAAVFQIVIFSMILASGAITAVLSTRLMSKELFTESHQLSYRG
ncbi:MAG TPA: iron export ABC transporter permease subunit FetB [Methanomassiliicoccales archaeon]|nr:iron export ABC transporter permease subunit FetB [Methanomassiliicoccales archaeon]